MTVRIATWNLENLFLPGQAPGAPDDRATYDAKLDTLAGVIDEMQPDLLAVQEVGDPEAALDLAGRLAGDWTVETADPDDRGIRVGFLSRSAMTNVEQVRDFPHGIGPVRVADDLTTINRLGRPGLRVRIRAGNRTIDAVSVHLKSKLLTFPGGRFSPRDEDERVRYAVYALHRRAAEAAGVRAYATSLLAEGADLVVGGDLNDEPQAATTQMLLGPPGSEVGTPGFEQPDQGDAQRLWNTAGFIDPEQRWSRVYRGRRELIDHVLCSDRLVHAVESAHTGDVGVASIGDSPVARRNEPVSDHRTVVVDVADA